MTALSAGSVAVQEDNDVRLMAGDELQLRHPNAGDKGPWQAVGQVVKFTDAGEVVLELKAGGAGVPHDVTSGYAVDFVWKSTSFDRMQAAMKSFAVDETSVSGYLYHKLLGHDVEEPVLKVVQPKRLSVTSLPELNASQTNAVRAVLQKPISLIQVRQLRICIHVVATEMLSSTTCPSTAPCNASTPARFSDEPLPAGKR